MSAIRNVGELASPYFLLEVWARREDIEIDPETYASLKRKTRVLVRDANAFELRGDEPDDEWRMRRLELLALSGTKQQAIIFSDGTESVVGVWRDPEGNDAILIGDLPGFADPDRRAADESDPPATRFELALDAYDGEADWGILLAGLEVRIYRRSSGISQQYLALDLDTLVELDEESTWKAFAAMFRSPAFIPDVNGITLIRRVVDESRRHASALAADMRRDVIDAAESIIQGALNYPANAAVIGEPTRPALEGLFEESLYILYRVLFVLFAEARGVLPLSGLGPYATTYSVDHLVELARRGGARVDGRYYHDTLTTLFGLLWNGPADSARRLGFEPVGGDLFDPDHTPTLGACVIPDAAWERALSSIALGAPGSARRKLGRRSSFGELGVDQLGSIYEGLLVLEPYLAREPAYLGVYKGDRRVSTDADTEGFDVLRNLQPGDFVLESAGGRRKGTGSFYTPHEITEYLSRSAIGPLVEPILKHSVDDPQGAAQKLLDIKVCDPAMGSGAFLVQAARILALALARIRANSSDGLVTPDRVQHAKREVVRHCLYGVDLNPLAAVLAKVSLWLETLEPGRPLSFLDSHLRCGDSLVGVDFVTSTGDFTAAELATFPVTAHKGLETYLRNEAGELGMPVLARLKNRKVPKAARQPMLPGFDHFTIGAALDELAQERQRIAELEEGAETLFEAFQAKESFETLEAAEDSIRNRLRRAANLWCAQWFNDGEDGVSDLQGPMVPASIADFEEVVAKLVTGATLPERLMSHVATAEAVHGKRNFFHWALEFPEVFQKRGGFDAIIGNPPWNETTPAPREFFATYDPKVFRKGVLKTKQEKRKVELREDREIDAAWRAEARWLYELSNYARPESGRFTWYAPDGQLRKGDANVFRLFVERAFRLLRNGGRLAQVLPDSLYISSPATGVRQKLLSEGLLESCYVFENRRSIFPIDSRIKVVLLTARRGGGPTERFQAAFFVGKDAAGRDRAVGLDVLPGVLADLEQDAPELSVDQVRALAPSTWSFPELQTALDAEIAAHCAMTVPSLNLGKEGWSLEYCRELDATNDSWRFRSSEELEDLQAHRDGIRWYGLDSTEWWPVVSGTHFYHLEFLAEGKEPQYWADSQGIRSIKARQNSDGSSVAEHYRVGWRLVASSTNERSVVASLLPPRSVCTNAVLTVWGGLLSIPDCLKLASVLASFVFDYLIRFAGRTNLTYGAISSAPVPERQALESVIEPAAEAVCQSREFYDIWRALFPARTIPLLDWWKIGERRAQVDAQVARAYGLSLEQFAAVLCTFPNIDTVQPMLPGELKSFVTRDLALLNYCQISGADPSDVCKLLRDIGVDLPEPRKEYRLLDARVAAARELGAVPYRPTPRGGKAPTDPILIEAVKDVLGSDALTAEAIAELVGEDEKTVATVLKDLEKRGAAFSEGAGKKRRYYVIEDLRGCSNLSRSLATCSNSSDDTSVQAFLCVTLSSMRNARN